VQGAIRSGSVACCAKKTRGFIQHGHVDPHRLLFVPQHLEQVREVVPNTISEIEDFVEQQHTAIYGDHPFLRPADQIDWLRRLLQRDYVRGALRLN